MKYRSLTTTLAAIALLVSAAACTSAPSVAPAPVAASGSLTTPPPGRDLHWARASAEHRAIYVETYRAAAERLATLASGRASGSWGVILDADETVLDNSDYEVGRVPFGGSFDAKGWTAWVNEGRAPALPGAAAFTNRVHQLGGRVVIVSNRDDAQCPITRTNLQQVSIPADLVLCKTTTDDKNPRFDAVQNGTAAPNFPAIAVLEWIGDNIQDFPHLSQSILTAPESAYARFGDTFFALPNAMYGSWQANPFR
jgi:5'-nucleotidase (lipoprotein e(P4) family)